jgi:hypothetical protein
MSKCCYVHFKPKSKVNAAAEPEMELSIDGFPIKKSKTAIFLGVVLGGSQTWQRSGVS